VRGVCGRALWVCGTLRGEWGQAMDHKATGREITFKDSGEIMWAEPAPDQCVEVTHVFRGTLDVVGGEPLRFSVIAPPLPPCTLRLMGFDGERWFELDGR